MNTGTKSALVPDRVQTHSNPYWQETGWNSTLRATGRTMARGQKGAGSVFQRTYRDTHGRKQRTRNWYFEYVLGGRTIRQGSRVHEALRRSRVSEETDLRRAERQGRSVEPGHVRRSQEPDRQRLPEQRAQEPGASRAGSPAKARRCLRRHESG
jgi:hypothetical protein